jgi:hypothetical protein
LPAPRRVLARTPWRQLDLAARLPPLPEGTVATHAALCVPCLSTRAPAAPRDLVACSPWHPAPLGRCLSAPRRVRLALTSPGTSLTSLPGLSPAARLRGGGLRGASPLPPHRSAAAALPSVPRWWTTLPSRAPVAGVDGAGPLPKEWPYRAAMSPIGLPRLTQHRWNPLAAPHTSPCVQRSQTPSPSSSRSSPSADLDRPGAVCALRWLLRRPAASLTLLPDCRSRRAVGPVPEPILPRGPHPLASSPPAGSARCAAASDLPALGALAVSGSASSPPTPRGPLLRCAPTPWAGSREAVGFGSSRRWPWGASTSSGMNPV